MAAPKAAPNLLSAEDNALFDAKIKEWQERLGLQGWRIERSKRKTKAMAQVEMHHKARLAVYRTGDFGGTAITPESIESCVIHELLHILLYELVNQADIGLTGEALEAAEHRAIHVLERMLLTLPKGDR